MFTYTDDIITAFDFVGVKFLGEPGVTTENGGVLATELFPINSKWCDRELKKM